MYPEGSAYPLRNLWDAAVRHYSVRLTCPDCGHARTFQGHALWWLFERRGWASGFGDVRRRMVCARCRDESGRKVRNARLELVREEPTGEPLPLPSKTEWKRALARHR